VLNGPATRELEEAEQAGATLEVNPEERR